MAIPRGIPSAVQGRVPGPGQPGGAGGPGGSAPPAPSAGYEVTIAAAPAFNQVLCQLPRYLSLQFSQVLNDKGAGTLEVNLDDPWFANTTLANGQPASTLFDDEHLVRCYQNGVLVFDFFMQTITEQDVDESEQRNVTITGPGTIAALGFAAAMPPGFPDIVFKTDAIEDGFAEIDEDGNLEVDTALWDVISPTADVTLNPSGTLQLTATSATTLCGATPYDLTESLISAQISPVGQGAAATPDGSQITQMYVQSNANSGDYALIGVTSAGLYCQLGDTQNGTQTKSLGAYDPTNQLYWQLSETNGQITFWTSADGVNYTQVWVVTPSWTPNNVTFYFGAAYDTAGAFVMQVTNVNGNIVTPSSAGNIYFGEPIMAIWFSIFQAAQARGTIPYIAPTFDAANDSFNNPWNDSNSVQIENGTDLYSLLQSHTAIVDADYLMNPGFQLVVGLPTTGLITIGTDRSEAIVFREAAQQQSKQRTRDRSTIANLVGAVNSDGTTISASDSDSIATWGQREGWVETAVQVNPESIAIAAQASVEQTSDEVDTITLQVAPVWPGATPFQDFQVGDWVGLENPGPLPGGPDFGGNTVDAIRVVAIAISIDATGAVTAELTVNTYLQWLQEQLLYLVNKLGGQFINSLGTTPVTSNASGPTQLPTIFAPNISSLGDTSTIGVTQGSPLVYNSVTGQWQPAGTADPNTGVLTPISMQTPGGTVAITPTGGGTTTPVITVSNPGGTSVVAIGLQTDGSVTAATTATPTPLVPDTPTVVGGILSILVAWDGLLASTTPLLSFQCVQVHVSTASGFTPSSSTLKGNLRAAGIFPVTNLTAGTTYYVKLVAQSQSGAVSAASTQASAAAQTVAANISAGSITAGMVNFTASGIGGITVSVSSVAPSSPNAGDLWFDGATGYSLMQWSGSAWVQYQYGTSAIAAGSITAALIAANTITASQIASGTITATQIAAGTISATQLAAGLVVAGIVDGTVLEGTIIEGASIVGQNVVVGESGVTSEMVLSPDVNLALDVTTAISGILEAAAQFSTTDTNETVAGVLGSLLLGSGSATKMATALTSPFAVTGSAMILESENDGATDTAVITFGTVSSPDDGTTVVFTPLAAILPYALLVYGNSSGQVAVTKLSGSGNITTPVSPVKAEAWGAGASGGCGVGGGSPAPGVSGGGAEYACEPSLVVGATTAFVVAASEPGTATSSNVGHSGTASTITGSSVTVTAHGGTAAGTAGTGSSNTIHFNGGTGGAVSGGAIGGPSGGSAAGTAAAGTAGQAAGTNGADASGVTIGPAGAGNGGYGGAVNQNGGAGTQPGGAGGGTGAGSTVTSGASGAGMVRLSWSTGAPPILMSVAAAAGTDQFGTSFEAGVHMLGADANTYRAEKLSQFLPGTISPTTTTAVPILSCPVVPGTYRFEGTVEILQGGGADAIALGLSGPAASPIRYFYDWIEDAILGSSGEEFSVNTNTGAWGMVNSPAYAAASTFYYHFKGYATFTAAGTFQIEAAQATGTTHTFTIEYALLDVWPVG